MPYAYPPRPACGVGRVAPWSGAGPAHHRHHLTFEPRELVTARALGWRDRGFSVNVAFRTEPGLAFSFESPAGASDLSLNVIRFTSLPTEALLPNRAREAPT